MYKIGIAAYVPVEIAERLDATARERGTSRSALVAEAVGAFLEVPLSLNGTGHNDNRKRSAIALTHKRVCAVFKPGEPVRYTLALGAESTFYRWKMWAQHRQLLMMVKGKWCLAPEAAINTEVLALEQPHA